MIDDRIGSDEIVCVVIIIKLEKKNKKKNYIIFKTLHRQK